MFYVSSDILNRIEICGIEWILPALYAKILTYDNTDFLSTGALSSIIIGLSTLQNDSN